MLEQDSALELELGLLGGVPSYDQLLVDCTLSLGGLLRIILTDDYMPSTGDFADFLVADSLALAFAGLELIAPGQQISWTAGGVDLPDARQAWGFEILSAQAVDEPSVPVLVGSASLAFVGYCRRRSMLGAGRSCWPPRAAPHKVRAPPNAMLGMDPEGKLCKLLAIPPIGGSTTSLEVLCAGLAL